MLYHLLFWLKEHFGLFNILKYQSFRAIAAFLLTFIIVLILQPKFIRWFREKQLGQPIRDDGPQSHYEKKGTPTMGGLVVILAILISSLLFLRFDYRLVWISLVMLIGYAGIGFYDDYIKVRYKNSKGISSRNKFLLQLTIAGVAVSMLYFFVPNYNSQILIPFTKGYKIELGYLFIPFATLVIVGTSNGVNLTDGLDGLVTGPLITTAFTYGVICYLAGNKELATYLQLHHIEGCGELSIICASLIAGGLGFLWFNSFPAQIFLGDVGSLSLGGIIGFFAVASKHEVLLLISGGVFVVEALSVIIQVASFKLTGKRVFKMAPLHHHFELKGIPEPKIIVRAWIISILLFVISLLAIKIR